MKCQVLAKFSTDIGDIYVIDFFYKEVIPSLGLKLKHSSDRFEITSVTVGYHPFDDGKGIQRDHVYSCKLKNMKGTDIQIPKGTILEIE
jgi:hypothetical protein